MAFVSLKDIIEQFLDDMEHKRLCLGCSEIVTTSRGDSVLEDRFWYAALRTDGGWHGATDQFQVGKYRVDAIFDCNGQAVVIELDGKAYHDREADHHRDKVLVQYVSAVIRIPFAAMWYYPEATFKVLGTWFPRLSKVEPVCLLSSDELRKEIQAVKEEGYYIGSEFIEDVENSYDVYSIDGNLAQVGSPKNFANSWGKPQVISVQRGQTATGIIDRIYEKSQCQIGKKSVRARAA